MSTVMKQRLPLLFVFFALFSLYECNRKVTTVIEHDCLNTTCGSYAYIKAVGRDDTLHYLVTTLGLPTIFVAYTDKDVSAKVDLKRFLSTNDTERQNSVTFTPGTGLRFSYSMIFTKLIEYDDTKDTADMTEYSPTTTEWNIFDMSEFKWENMSAVSDPDSNKISLQAKQGNDDQLWNDKGTFTIQLSAFGTSGREDQLPHLQFSENITQFDLTLDHLSTNLTKSRFAIEVAIVGEDAGVMHVDETRSIDDEYSPGVFMIYNWLTDKTGSKGFVQWKSVCYTAKDRTRATGTGMKHYKMRVSSPVEPFMSTLVYGYYGDKLTDKMIAVGNFSFGLSQDGGYNKTQILSWSGSIGYGIPPSDSISMLVIIIISAGLGLPVILIIFGGIFVCIKKRSGNKDKPLRNIQGYQSVPDN